MWRLGKQCPTKPHKSHSTFTENELCLRYLTLSFLMFVFQAKIIGYYVLRLERLRLTERGDVVPTAVSMLS